MVEGSVRMAGLRMRNEVSLDPASTDANSEDCEETTSFNTVSLVSQRTWANRRWIRTSKATRG